jgi:hypothetical protein
MTRSFSSTLSARSRALLCVVCAGLLVPLLTAKAQQPSAGSTATAPAPNATDSNSDVLFWRNGKEQKGRVLSTDPRGIRFQVVLVANQPPATVTIPLSEIARIEFAPNPAEDALLNAGKDRAAIVALWKQRQPLLGLPTSNAGAFGLAVANLALSGTDTPSREEALRIFQTIESTDWDDERRSLARRGRLRTMIALGKGADAVAEARKIAEEAEDPQVAIEANLVLGDAAFAQLKKLEEDNPRWDEDVNVRPERQRLLLEALDHLLYPALFHGSDQASSAKGLWRALEVCQFDKRLTHAVELARDLTELYPKSDEAARAVEFLKTQSTESDKTKSDES